MRTYLDGELLDPPVATLSEALDAARAHRSGRFVVEALADDAPVPPEHLDSPPTGSPYANELHLNTADAASLVKVMLLDAASIVEDAGARQQEAARLLHTGKMQEALGALGEIMQAWDGAHRALKLAESSGLLVAPAEARASESGNLGKLLAELKTSLHQRDWSSLADTLEYDLTELAGRWSEMLGTMADGIGSVD